MRDCFPSCLLHKYNPKSMSTAFFRFTCLRSYFFSQGVLHIRTWATIIIANKFASSSSLAQMKRYPLLLSLYATHHRISLHFYGYAPFSCSVKGRKTQWCRCRKTEKKCITCEVSMLALYASFQPYSLYCSCPPRDFILRVRPDGFLLQFIIPFVPASRHTLCVASS